MNQRSFIFRAWDSKLKQWALEEFYLFGETTMFDQLGAYLIETRGIGKALPAYNDLIVTQQSPFKDKDQNTIFEGDILKEGNDLYIVSFGEIKLGPDDWGVQRVIHGWRIQFLDEEDSYGTLSQNDPGYGVCTSDCLIAGNIFQHKHLIEK